MIFGEISVLSKNLEDIHICELDKHQMQSLYIMIDYKIYYIIMTPIGYIQFHHTHNNNKECMYKFFEARPNETFKIYSLSSLENLNGYFDSIEKNIKDNKIKYIREYNLSKLFNYL